MTAVSIREWWDAKGRAVAQRDAQLGAAARERGIALARGLQSLSDDELISQAQARTSLSYPYHEMEMQRRLKDSIQELTAETRLSRRSSDRWSLIIAVLTAAIVAFTIVLALKA